MKPLQWIGMGLVVVLLVARLGGYDALPDPVGWVLVALGVSRLTGPRHRLLLALALVAGAVSAALWLPRVNTALQDADPSLAWAANLPQLAFLVLLCHELGGTARVAGDVSAARWWSTARVLGVVVAALPVLVFGAGLDQLEGVSYLAAGTTLLLVIWLLFAHAGRPWAVVESRESPAAAPSGS